MVTTQYQHQVESLIESLPYLQQLCGEFVVIKYGGHAMTDDFLKESFAKNIVFLKSLGIQPIIVHGGGPQIGSFLKKLNIESSFREGLRVTDDATMEVVEMVLVGKVNKEIVSQINRAGGKAVGISGKDGSFTKCKKIEKFTTTEGGKKEYIDFGRVGEVTEIDTTLIHSLCKDNFIPVIAPTGVGEDYESYNINADSVASAVAAALKAKNLLLLTDVIGILGKDKELISSITKEKAIELFHNGTLQGGMIPKVECALAAIDAGVEKVVIIDGRVENCILCELFTKAGVGTRITKE